MRTVIELPVENEAVDSVERKVKLMYQKCMNDEDMEDAIKQLRDIFITAKAGIRLIYLIHECYIFSPLVCSSLAITLFHFSSLYVNISCKNIGFFKLL